MVSTYNWIIALLWFVFWLIWFFSALNTKKSIRNGLGSRGFFLRILIAVIVLYLIRIFAFQQTSSIAYSTVHQVDPITGSLGVLLCAAGIAFAVWARFHLGRNWGMPMSLKENPELVTTGPYRLVRHPIYTGMLIAIVGSILVAGLPWLLILVFAAIYFYYSAKTEEKIMTRQFPDRYLEYKKKSKMLIPYIF